MKTNTYEMGNGREISSQDLREWLKEQKEFYIYVAGIVCKKFLLWANEMDISNRIKGIIVTKKGSNPSQLNGIPLIEISDIKDNFSYSILLTVSGYLYPEIVCVMCEFGITDFTYVDDDLLTFLEGDLKKINRNKIIKQICKKTKRKENYKKSD